MEAAHKAHHEHVRSKQPNGEMAFTLLISDKAQKIQMWVELIVLCNNPMQIVEDDVCCKWVQQEGCTHCFTCKNLIVLADIVGLLIKQSIGPGNCMGDGWSCAGIHYFGLMHQWLALVNGKIEKKTALLSCQPFVDETKLNAATTKESTKATHSICMPDSVKTHPTSLCA